MQHDQTRQGVYRPDQAPTGNPQPSDYFDRDTAVYSNDGSGHDNGYGQPVAQYRQDRPEADSTRTMALLAGLAVLVLAVVGLVAFIAFSGGGDATESIVVPTVIGEQQTAAMNRLVDAGFIVNVEFLEKADVEPGVVFAQTPEPGTEHDPTEPVTIFVAAGAETVVVPDVVDRRAEQAQSELTALGFTVTLTEEPGTEEDAGRVIRQSIEPGQEANVGAEIALTVSSGPGSVAVPDVLNQAQANAERILIDAGFVPRVGFVEVQADGGSVGNVISQNPTPGREATPGTEVVLNVGRTTGTTTTTAQTTTTAAPTSSVQTTAPAVDLVGVSEQFATLWAAGDFEGLADIADPEAVAVAQEWYEPGGEGTGCETVQAQACELLYTPGSGGTALVFEVTFSADGFVRSLTFAGDAG